MAITTAAITTTAAIVEAPGASFTIADVTLDEPRDDEVLVRMVAAGLCHTDLGVRAGGIPFPLPGILGHEGAGPEGDVGADGQVREQRVVLEADAALLAGGMGDVAVADAHGPGVGVGEPGDDAEQRGLPDPEEPSMQQKLPSSTVRSRGCRAVAPLKVLLTPEMVTVAMG